MKPSVPRWARCVTAKPTAAADGDDVTGTADEDGVVFGTLQVGAANALVTATAGAKLDAWLDFDGDGTWNGPLEQIADSVTIPGSGILPLQFELPGWAVSGDNYARFRLSTAGNLPATGGADDGEDYQVTITAPAAAGLFGSQQVISNTAAGARAVYEGDIDGDGLTDVVSASETDDTIAWSKNLGGGVFGAEQLISTLANVARSVVLADLDGDGDLDAISGSIGRVDWYENTDGLGTFGVRQLIGTPNTPTSVFAAGVDGDGDQDVVASAFNSQRLEWFENTDGLGTWGAVQVVGSPGQVSSVFAADLDQDGDLDLLSASVNQNRIAWWEAVAGSFVQHIITSSAAGAQSVFAADLDGDGDMDVLSASYNDDKIAWYENTGGGVFGAQQIITTAADGARAVFAADLDVLSASDNDSKIAWYENTGGTFGAQQIITTLALGAQAVFTADLSGDGGLVPDQAKALRPSLE